MPIVVTHCGKQPRFAFNCSKTWGELDPAGNYDNVRFCGDCQKPVHFVETGNAFARATRLGQCVAIEVNDDFSGRVTLLSIPAQY